MTSKESQCNLIVNYLPQSLSDEEFETMFRSIGPIKASKVVRDKATGLSYGYGFVEYESPEHSQRAVDTLDGLNLQTKRIKVAHARVTQDVRPSNLYISNLPHHLGDAELTALFVPYGTIVRSRVLVEPTTHESRGVGFVQYATHDEAQRAINSLNDQTPPGFTGPMGVKFAEDTREKVKKGKQMMNTVGQMMGGNASMMGGVRPPFGMGGQMGGAGGMMNQGCVDQFGGMNMNRGVPSFGAASNQFGAPGNQFGAPSNQFGAPPNQFGAPQNQFGTPQNQFGAPPNQSNQFGMDYQGDVGGGPMRNGSQVRQRFDPMSFPGGLGTGGGMNGNGAAGNGINSTTGYPLFVYNIGLDTDERALWQLFYPFGALQKVAVVRDNEKKVGKGYGFVTMVNLLEAQNAILNLNGMVYKDKQLQVSLKQPKNAAAGGGTASPSASSLKPSPNLNPLSPSVPMMTPPTADKGQGYALFVYNIGTDADERSLWMLFSTFGAIQKVAIMRTSDTNVCKGFGFVTMAEMTSAMNAIQALNGHMYKGRALQVSFKQAKSGGEGQ